MSKENLNITLRSLTFAILKVSLAGLFLFPVISNSLSGFFVLVFGVFAMIHFLINEKTSPKKQDIVVLLLFALIPVVYTSELLVAADISYVWSVAQRKMGLLFIPLGFFLLSYSQVKIVWRNYLNLFVFAVVGLMFYVCVYILLKGLNYQYIESGGFAYGLRTFIEEIARLHPTYFGMMLCFALLYIVSLVLKTSSNILKTLGVLLSLFIFGFIMLLASRIVIISGLVGFLIISLIELKTIKKRLLFLTVAGIVMVTSIVLVPSVHERVSELMNDNVNSTSIRYSIVDCSTELVKSNWLLGASIENTQVLLDDCYENKGASLILKGLNSHNEYLNIILTKGVFLLVSFLGLIFVLFVRARGNLLFIIFLSIFTIVCLTENLLERQMGVFFFSLFASAFYFLETSSEKTKID